MDTLVLDDPTSRGRDEGETYLGYRAVVDDAHMNRKIDGSTSL